METKLSMGQLDELVRIFLSWVGEEEPQVPEYVRDRMTIVAETQSTLFELGPSNIHDSDIADQVSAVVPMHANAGGGFIVVGADPATLEPLGTAIDSTWLKARLVRTVDAAVEMKKWVVCGVEILVVFVLPGVSPVSDERGMLVLPSGVVDRGQWWSDAESNEPASAVSAETMNIVRECVGECGDMSDEEVLAHIGAATHDGTLTNMGFYLLAPVGVPRFSLNSQWAEGGSTLEGLVNVEKRISELNKPVEWGVGDLTSTSRPVPEQTVRDALAYVLSMNKLNHPVEITWSSDNALTFEYMPREHTSREMLDLLRALGLANPRMQGRPKYPIDGRAMITLGLTPPRFDDTHVYLFGGEPDWNVVRFLRGIRPQRILENELVLRALDLFFQEPYVTAASLAAALSIDEGSALDVLIVLSVSGAGGSGIIRGHCHGWVLGDGARHLLGHRLAYLRPATYDGLTGLRTFLDQYGTVNEDDLVALQGADAEEAEQILFEMELDGVLEEKTVGEYEVKAD